GDTLAQVEARGREVEHRLFPRALEMAAAGEIRGREGR
ncbi:MAG: phosphoribosylglycinamide formyltransferase, partial [Bdellovibrionales bacterium]|nr:phosphoribosylglycinamide formyltransferase [Bdellovibrionales bacterium]